MRDATLFAEALDRPPADRAAFLADACGADLVLRRRVEKLLAAHDRAGDFLAPPVPTPHAGPDTPAEGSAVPGEPPELPGGRYRVVGRLGEGGMGVVYRAEQAAPVRRQVAVKVVRPGMGSAAVLARFDAERQALAVMDHPHIATVFDGGATTAGLPYFVMEYVPGPPVTTFCDTRELGRRQRLELFAGVCDAVHHAHQKGVIHRDLKPSNVLVTDRDGKPVPKVIDFGVAKALDPRLGPTGATEFGTVVGTPEYMSPEQADLNAAVDTRTDIYALAVLLYELLTGNTPHDRDRLRGTSVLEALRIVREEEPVPPSRRTPVPRELDWITLKGLAKDRDRRYESAAALAADVRRYLADRPVLAGPPSARYAFGKFVRRNRAAVVVAGLLAAGMVAGTVGTTVGMLWAWEAERQADLRRTDAVNAEARASDDRDRAVAAEADATAFNGFVIDHILSASRPERLRDGLGRSVTLADAIAAAEPNLEASFAGRPAAEARARAVIARTWHKLGRLAEAERQYRLAIDILTRAFGPNAEDTLTTQVGLVHLLSDLSRYPEARRLGEDTLRQAADVLPPDHDAVLAGRTFLAVVYFEMGMVRVAVTLFRTIYDDHLRVYGPNHSSTLSAMNNLGLGLTRAHRWAEAEALFEELVCRRTADAGPDATMTLLAACNWAHCLHHINRRQAALDVYLDTKARATTALSGEHRITLKVCDNLILLYCDMGRTADALPLAEETLRTQERVFGKGHKDTLASVANLARVHKTAGRLDLAIPLYRDAIDGLATHFGPTHPATLAATYNFGHAYHLAGRPADALPLLEVAAAGYREENGTADPVAVHTAVLLARTYVALGREADAEPWLLAARPYFDSPEKHRSPDGVSFARALVAVRVRGGKPAEAENLLRDSLQAVGRTNPLYTTVLRSDLGWCLTALGRYEEAEPHLLAGAAGLKPGKVDANRMIDTNRSRLVELYDKWGKPERAAEWRGRADQASPSRQKPPGQKE